jgi:hypothetical protein
MKKALLSIVILLSSFSISPSSAQTQATASGHWEGSIDAQGNIIEVGVDLVRDDKGLWKGLINIAAQQLNAYPLSNVKVDGANVGFEMSSVPGLPTFKGKLSADGKIISGEVMQSGMNFTFKLDKKGDAKITANDLAVSIKSAVNLEGNWQGPLDTGNGILRLILKITKIADGSFTAFLDSPDQGAQNLPINSLTVTDSAVNFEIKYISASFQGTLSKDGNEITGTWTQAGSAPLTLKRQPKPGVK